MEKLLTYATFFVTRNPFERLVSAHISKFLKTSKLRQKIGKPLAQREANINLPAGIHYNTSRLLLIWFPERRKKLAL